MAKILVYTFNKPRQITFKILRSIDLKPIGEKNNYIDSRLRGNDIEMSVDKYYLGNLKSLAKHILETQPKYVLGLGGYRKDSKEIRVEKDFVNRYGKKPIIKGSKDKYQATWELKKQEGVIFSENPTFGPCNRSAYVLLKFIEENSLPTKLAFVHIPSSFSEVRAMEIIDKWIKEYTEVSQ